MTSPTALSEYAQASAALPGATTAAGFQSTALDRQDADFPDFPSPAYLRMEPRWTLCRALMIGTEAIREGAEAYLPRLAGESDADYRFRSVLVACPPAFERTVKASVGLINQTAPIVGDDMPQAIADLFENIDLQGTHLNVFTKNLTRSGVVDGYAGILVDYQRADDPNIDRSRASAAAQPGAPLSADDETRLGLRPYWILVEVDDVIKLVYSRVNGVRTLILLVIRETTQDLVGAFGLTTTTRYRVYRRTPTGVTYELWEKSYGEALSHRTLDPRPMRNVSEIPWAPFATGEEIGAGEWKPPLLDLAYLNLEHYQVKTNIRNLETLGCVPTQVRIGASPDDDGNYPVIVLGPRSTIEAPYNQGLSQPIYWHSPDVTVLDPSNRSLTDIKADEGAAGLAFLAPDSRSAETAAAKRIDSTAQNATITTVAGKLQDCLERAAQFTAQYMAITSGSMTVNTDYENTVMDAPMVAALGALAANGKLDIETLLDLLEDGHILPDGTDKDAILSRILKENAALDVTPPAPRQIGAGGGSGGSDNGGDTSAPPGGNADSQTGDQQAA